jgi:hypothetical protein
MALGRGKIIALERFDSQHVVRVRVVSAKPQCRLGLADHVGAASLLLRLKRQRQMLFSRCCHRAREDCRFRAGSSYGMSGGE